MTDSIKVWTIYMRTSSHPTEVQAWNSFTDQGGATDKAEAYVGSRVCLRPAGEVTVEVDQVEYSEDWMDLTHWRVRVYETDGWIEYSIGMHVYVQQQVEARS